MAQIIFLLKIQTYGESDSNEMRIRNGIDYMKYYL